MMLVGAMVRWWCDASWGWDGGCHDGRGGCEVVELVVV